MNEDSLNKFVNSRYCFILLLITALGASFAMSFAGMRSATGSDGLFFASPDTWLAPGLLSWITNALCIGTTCLILLLLNKTFAFVREYTVIYASLFVVMTWTNPAVSASLNSSTIMAMVLSMSAYILFSRFQQPDKRSAIFLIVLILASCSMFCYSFLLFIPLFAIGFFQMQIFRFKGFLALLAGMVVPATVAWAFGLIDLTSFRFPYLGLPDEGVHSVFSNLRFLHLLYTVALGTVFGLSNILTLMSYRLQLRAYNGFLDLMAIFALIGLLLDIQNAATYIVPINMLVAFQAAHFFTINRFRRSYLVFAVIVAIDLAFSAADAFQLIQL